MKVYISGPMSEIKDYNREAFSRAAAMLRADPRFTEVVSPAELDHAPGACWVDYMRRDIAELVKCDAVYMLRGWQMSRGAHLEFTIAHGLYFKILEEVEE